MKPRPTDLATDGGARAAIAWVRDGKIKGNITVIESWYWIVTFAPKGTAPRQAF